MNVGELIDALMELPENADVWFGEKSRLLAIDSVVYVQDREDTVLLS